LKYIIDSCFTNRLGFLFRFLSAEKMLKTRLNIGNVGSVLKIYIIVVGSVGSELSSPTNKNYRAGAIKSNLSVEKVKLLKVCCSSPVRPAEGFC
jgi:hypothetical protein